MFVFSIVNVYFAFALSFPSEQATSIAAFSGGTGQLDSEHRRIGHLAV